MLKTVLRHETIEDDIHPGDYRVEAIGDDGEIYTASFLSPDAQIRAQEYVDCKNSSQHSALAKAS